ncbi:metal-dependent hydrolase [Halovivax gelatinilyticus]|uniref:metal-dependent hydrolase n=1 Tax=Halovivax gelatinilyticus TaxID=2961597 RepID=UPI0020CA755A|nr:metal-dependent hydrolase [Halovivax gelatinilyticus]
MATTHAFAALALVSPVAYAAPELATPLAIGAILGGLAPDLDVAFDHRRTLHFPILGAIPALGSVALATLVTTPLSVGVAAFFVGVWLHAASDAIGGGSEWNPWTNPTDRAVYDHARGRWIRPRRWIRHDGAPEDAAAAIALAVLALYGFESLWIRGLIGVGLVVSVGYALVRRRVAEWAGPES